MEAEPDFVAPDYCGQSILNLHDSLLDAFRVDSEETRSRTGAAGPLADAGVRELLGGARRIVVLLLDALGYRALQAFRATCRFPLLERLIAAGRFLPLTTVFPSATNNVLHAFHTGLAPGSHGIPGYRLYLRQAGVVGELITFTQFSDVAGGEQRSLAELGVRAEDFAATTLFDRLSAGGVPNFVVFRRSLLGSYLSGLNHRGAGRIVPFVDTADQMIQVRRSLEELGDRRGLVYTYWDAIDTIQHIYGAAGEETEAELSKILFSMEREWLGRLSREDARGTVLVLLSDHGQVTVRREDYVSLYAFDDVVENVERPFGGNERVTYLRAKPHRRDALRQALGRALPGDFRVLSIDELLGSGLLGPGEAHVELRSRVGDFIVLAPPARALAHRVAETRRGGMHGGLTPEEMLVPLVVVDLGEVVP